MTTGRFKICLSIFSDDDAIRAMCARALSHIVDVDQARDGVVSGNLVYNITSRGNPAYGNEESSDGIYVDGGTRILIEQNVMHDDDFGIELASEHKDRATSYITARRACSSSAASPPACAAGSTSSSRTSSPTRSSPRRARSTR
jgi:hypothetical protein